jgi:hypothetical protein
MGTEQLAPERLTPQALHPGLYTALSFGFGFVCVATILTIAVFIPSPTLFQQRVFLSVLALALGGVAAVISGILDVQLALGKQLFVGATGALAVFVLVYFYNPAIIAATPAPSESGSKSDLTWQRNYGLFASFVWQKPISGSTTFVSKSDLEWRFGQLVLDSEADVKSKLEALEKRVDLAATDSKAPDSIVIDNALDTAYWVFKASLRAAAASHGVDVEKVESEKVITRGP